MGDPPPDLLRSFATTQNDSQAVKLQEDVDARRKRREERSRLRHAQRASEQGEADLEPDAELAFKRHSREASPTSSTSSSIDNTSRTPKLHVQPPSDSARSDYTPSVPGSSIRGTSPDKEPAPPPPSSPKRHSIAIAEIPPYKGPPSVTPSSSHIDSNLLKSLRGSLKLKKGAQTGSTTAANPSRASGETVNPPPVNAPPPSPRLADLDDFPDDVSDTRSPATVPKTSALPPGIIPARRTTQRFVNVGEGQDPIAYDAAELSTLDEKSERDSLSSKGSNGSKGSRGSKQSQRIPLPTVGRQGADGSFAIPNAPASPRKMSVIPTAPDKVDASTDRTKRSASPVRQISPELASRISLFGGSGLAAAEARLQQKLKDGSSTGASKGRDDGGSRASERSVDLSDDGVRRPIDIDSTSQISNSKAVFEGELHTPVPSGWRVRHAVLTKTALFFETRGAHPVTAFFTCDIKSTRQAGKSEDGDLRVFEVLLKDGSVERLAVNGRHLGLLWMQCLDGTIGDSDPDRRKWSSSDEMNAPSHADIVSVTDDGSVGARSPTPYVKSRPSLVEDSGGILKISPAKAMPLSSAGQGVYPSEKDATLKGGAATDSIRRRASDLPDFESIAAKHVGYSEDDDRSDISNPFDVPTQRTPTKSKSLMSNEQLWEQQLRDHYEGLEGLTKSEVEKLVQIELWNRERKFKDRWPSRSIHEDGEAKEEIVSTSPPNSKVSTASKIPATKTPSPEVVGSSAATRPDLFASSDYARHIPIKPIIESVSSSSSSIRTTKSATRAPLPSTPVASPKKPLATSPPSSTTKPFPSPSRPAKQAFRSISGTSQDPEHGSPKSSPASPKRGSAAARPISTFTAPEAKVQRKMYPEEYHAVLERVRELIAGVDDPNEPTIFLIAKEVVVTAHFQKIREALQDLRRRFEESEQSADPHYAHFSQSASFFSYFLALRDPDCVHSHWQLHQIVEVSNDLAFTTSLAHPDGSTIRIGAYDLPEAQLETLLYLDRLLVSLMWGYLSPPESVVSATFHPIYRPKRKTRDPDRTTLFDHDAKSVQTQAAVHDEVEAKAWQQARLGFEEEARLGSQEASRSSPSSPYKQSTGHKSDLFKQEARSPPVQAQPTSNSAHSEYRNRRLDELAQMLTGERAQAFSPDNSPAQKLRDRSEAEAKLEGRAVPSSALQDAFFRQAVPSSRSAPNISKASGPAPSLPNTSRWSESTPHVRRRPNDDGFGTRTKYAESGMTPGGTSEFTQAGILHDLAMTLEDLRSMMHRKDQVTRSRADQPDLVHDVVGEVVKLLKDDRSVRDQNWHSLEQTVSALHRRIDQLPQELLARVTAAEETAGVEFAKPTMDTADEDDDARTLRNESTHGREGPTGGSHHGEEQEDPKAVTFRGFAPLGRALSGKSATGKEKSKTDRKAAKGPRMPNIRLWGAPEPCDPELHRARWGNGPAVRKTTDEQFLQEALAEDAAATEAAELKKARIAKFDTLKDNEELNAALETLAATGDVKDPGTIALAVFEILRTTKEMQQKQEEAERKAKKAPPGLSKEEQAELEAKRNHIVRLELETAKKSEEAAKLAATLEGLVAKGATTEATLNELKAFMATPKANVMDPSLTDAVKKLLGQVKTNVDDHVKDFRGQLAAEVSRMYTEVGKLREEKKGLQGDIAELLAFQAKNGGKVPAAAADTATSPAPVKVGWSGFYGPRPMSSK